MTKKGVAALIAAILGLLAAYPELKSSVQEMVNDIMWALQQLRQVGAG